MLKMDATWVITLIALFAISQYVICRGIYWNGYNAGAKRVLEDWKTIMSTTDEEDM